ncbi:MAG: PRC-barrel domain-containing protein [Cytophagaceae bacterium]
MNKANTTTDNRLIRLNETDEYEISEGYVDIRNWNITSGTGENVGKVYDLIVDKIKMEVRYVDVLASAELSHSGGERHLLIPIGMVKINYDDEVIVAEQLDKQLLQKYPEFRGGPIALDYEHSLVETIKGPGTTVSSADELYLNELYASAYRGIKLKSIAPNPEEYYNTPYKK